MDIHEVDETIRNSIKTIEVKDDDNSFTDLDIVGHIGTSIGPERSKALFDFLRGHYTYLLCKCDMCCITAWLFDPRDKGRLTGKRLRPSL